MKLTDDSGSKARGDNATEKTGRHRLFTQRETRAVWTQLHRSWLTRHREATLNIIHTRLSK